MRNKKYFYTVFLLIIITQGSFFSCAKDEFDKDTTFSFSIDAAFGASLNINYLFEDKEPAFDYTPMIRLLWKPNNDLSIGIETSLIKITNVNKTNVQTEFGIANIKGGVRAIPLVFVFNINKFGFDLFGGVGAAFVMTSIDSFNQTSKSSIIAGSYLYGLGYCVEVDKRLRIGIELFNYFITNIDRNIAGSRLKLSYDFYHW